MVKYSSYRSAFLALIFHIWICHATNEQNQINENVYTAPTSEDAFFVETFEEYASLDGSNWLKSTNERYASQDIEIRTSTLSYGVFKEDKGLVLTKPAKHYGVAFPLQEPFTFAQDKDELVVQYEVKLEEGLECGGAYIKLMNEQTNMDQLNDQSPYVIMFGPDICGLNNKVHFIFRHQNPVSKEFEEKHMKDAPKAKQDKFTHLYTLIIRKDNTFDILIDLEVVKSGNLLNDFDPPVNPSEEIDDPDDKKPEDWVDEEKISDPSASKPDDWDETAPATIPDEDAVKPSTWLDDEKEMIPDPSLKKPDDWDTEEDGEYEAPYIPNPKCENVGCGVWKRPTKTNPNYKGKWKAPIIDNPNYKGVWKPRKIKNPHYFQDDNPYMMKPIGAVAIEIWTMSGGIIFDNFWFGFNSNSAKNFALESWKKEFTLEMENDIEQEKKRSKEERQNLLSEGGFSNLLVVYSGDLVQLVRENILVAVLSLVVVLLTTILLCCRGSSTNEEVREEEETLKENEKVKQNEQEESSSEESEPQGEKQQTIKRRRPPKAE